MSWEVDVIAMPVGGRGGGGELPGVSDMSEPGDLALANGPESRFVVDAVAALQRGEVNVARAALIEGAAIAGWDAIAHRVDVAGRALTTDAGFTPDTVPDEVDLVPEILATSVEGAAADPPDVLDRWCQRVGSDLPHDRLWPAFVMLTWLVDQAGYPPEVVV